MKEKRFPKLKKCMTYPEIIKEHEELVKDLAHTKKQHEIQKKELNQYKKEFKIKKKL